MVCPFLHCCVKLSGHLKGSVENGDKSHIFDESQILVAISARFKIGNLCTILAKITRANKSAILAQYD